MTPSVRQVVLFNNIYPGASVALDFAAGRYRLGSQKGNAPSLLSGWTFTRASTGYAETAAGALVAFASGAPRITDKGLLVEEARTNLLLRSQEFDNASWTKTGTGVASAPVVTADQGVAPDGTLTADLVVFALNGGTASGDISGIQQDVSSVGNTTQSLWAKTSDGSTKVLSYVPPGGSTVTAVTITGAWQRISVSEVAAGTAAQRLRLRGSASGEGTADSASIYLWGAQLEVGAFPTSYIPTTTASATRAADVPTLTLSSTATGTLVSDALGAPGAGLTKTAAHVSLSNADDSTAWVIFGQTNMSGAVTIFRRAAGVDGNIIAGSTFSAGARTKIATRFGSAGGDAVSVNGAAVVTVAAAASPFVMTQLRPGRWASDPGELNNYVRQIILYPTEFTNAQLVAATA